MQISGMVATPASITLADHGLRRHVRHRSGFHWNALCGRRQQLILSILHLDGLHRRWKEVAVNSDGRGRLGCINTSRHLGHKYARGRLRRTNARGRLNRCCRRGCRLKCTYTCKHNYPTLSAKFQCSIYKATYLRTVLETQWSHYQFQSDYQKNQKISQYQLQTP